MSQVRMYTPPARAIKRKSPRWGRQRPITRGGSSDHEASEGGTPATGATAGAPGSFTPAGAEAPASVAAMAGLTASPNTPWTAQQYVQTKTAGNAGRATWSGSSWVGWIPAVFDAQNPGSHTVAEVQAWVDDNPDMADEILSLEEHDRARITLIDWLMGFIAHRDEDD